MFVSCRKKDVQVEPEPRYKPTDVLVGMKNDASIADVFQFINSYEHEVETITGSFYISDLPVDSLEYVLLELNQKPYLTNPGWKVGGYVADRLIHVFPRMYSMNQLSNQSDWLNTVSQLKLKLLRRSSGGVVLYLHVPAGAEKDWVEKFKEQSDVQWADLNYYADIVLN
ncbi:hypothetical protein DSL64_04835 [Dyadobacter luteus]|uniref:Uncharacterized protein n=2 Tax=Dyadobacter luteus TaxID=2259619 RepID=A0A3D8YH94_9BACT|nr:hypothetical protein DSL64_04835 [Dyadobacter luteus]